MENKKNILILTGSPRKGGNSDMLADAFINGLETNGHTVVKFNAGKKKIAGCIACNKCFSKGNACIFNDDFNELAPLMENSDMIVLITPLYWFTFPAQIKAALDKIYSLLVGKREIKIKESMLIVCAETDDMTDFDGIVRSYELINRYMDWEDCGKLLIPEVSHIGDILKTDALQKAEELGKTIT
ncbi:MAG: flavodoxin family protein [Bacteroidales bacterium]|jgi:multimeric flavodoxin WrbA|nr:flavodoxin family protein [Bacteroidales bacterium]